MILHFENELLKSISGEVIPGGSEADRDSTIALKEHEVGSKADKLENAESGESWVESLKFWKNEDAVVTPKTKIKSPKVERPVTEESPLSIKNSIESEKAINLDSMQTIDSNSSVSEAIQKDMESVESNIADDATVPSDSISDSNEPNEVKQDIIDSEPKAKDYFDLMLEKIGF